MIFTFSFVCFFTLFFYHQFLSFFVFNTTKGLLIYLVVLVFSQFMMAHSFQSLSVYQYRNKQIRYHLIRIIIFCVLIFNLHNQVQNSILLQILHYCCITIIQMLNILYNGCHIIVLINPHQTHLILVTIYYFDTTIYNNNQEIIQPCYYPSFSHYCHVS